MVAAYDAPFPDETYKAGARQFPLLVPIAPDDPAAAANRAAWQGLERFEKPFLTAFSDGDPVTRGGEVPLQQRIPGARGQRHTTIAGGGHFLQEDCGEQLAKVVIDFIAATRTRLNERRADRAARARRHRRTRRRRRSGLLAQRRARERRAGRRRRRR